MAITIPYSASQTTGTSLAITSAGNRRCLVVKTAAAQTAVSYAGVALTEVLDDGLWILFNPPVGAETVTLSNSSGASACLLNNINSSLGVIASASDGVVGTNDLVNDLSGVASGDIQISGMHCIFGYTELYSGTLITYAGTHIAMAYKIATGTTVSVTWVGDDTKYAYGLALRGDDSLEDAGVSAVSLSDYGVM